MMRSSGRAADELRAITIERGFTNQTPGSVLVSFGDTRVLCTASIEENVPPWMRGTARGWVTAEYAMLPGSSAERVRRDNAKKGRSQEISRLIGRSLRAVSDLEGIGESQIILDCDVLQADGGTRTAAITGAYVALHDACQWAMDKGRLPEIPLTSPCAAVSVGMVDGEALLDLCYEEDVRAEVDLNVVRNGAGQFLEIQGCAEKKPFDRDALSAMLDLAEKGIEELVSKQKEILGLV